MRTPPLSVSIIRGPYDLRPSRTFHIILVEVVVSADENLRVGDICGVQDLVIVVVTDSILFLEFFLSRNLYLYDVRGDFVQSLFHDGLALLLVLRMFHTLVIDDVRHHQTVIFDGSVDCFVRSLGTVCDAGYDDIRIQCDLLSEKSHSTASESFLGHGSGEGAYPFGVQTVEFSVPPLFALPVVHPTGSHRACID